MRVGIDAIAERREPLRQLSPEGEAGANRDGGIDRSKCADMVRPHFAGNPPGLNEAHVTTRRMASEANEHVVTLKRTQAETNKFFATTFSGLRAVASVSATLARESRRMALKHKCSACFVG